MSVHSSTVGRFGQCWQFSTQCWCYSAATVLNVNWLTIWLSAWDGTQFKSSDFSSFFTRCLYFLNKYNNILGFSRWFPIYYAQFSFFIFPWERGGEARRGASSELIAQFRSSSDVPLAPWRAPWKRSIFDGFFSLWRFPRPERQMLREVLKSRQK